MSITKIRELFSLPNVHYAEKGLKSKRGFQPLIFLCAKMSSCLSNIHYAENCNICWKD